MARAAEAAGVALLAAAAAELLEVAVAKAVTAALVAKVVGTMAAAIAEAALAVVAGSLVVVAVVGLVAGTDNRRQLGKQCHSTRMAGNGAVGAVVGSTCGTVVVSVRRWLVRCTQSCSGIDPR